MNPPCGDLRHTVMNSWEKTCKFGLFCLVWLEKMANRTLVIYF